MTTENRLSDLAATALQEQIGYPVWVGERENKSADEYTVRQNGRLFIGEQEHHSFVLEVRKNLTQALVDQLHAATPSQEPVALVVPYVSDKLGQELQRRGVCYLDTAGNAYLQTTTSDFFVLIRGNRQPKASAQVQHRAFQPAGVQLLYHLLSEPALLQASYRTMAEQAQVALGSVSILLKGLQQLELLRDESGKRRWTDPAQVLRRWVDAYGEVVRPKLPAQRYRWLDPAVARQGWQNLDLGPDMAWGASRPPTCCSMATCCPNTLRSTPRRRGAR
ncbi:hypothetical protein [Hymenobacter sp. BRD128]|uniref:hypothetical protein n=1 Tax=Hymenobacter sp. BRD128 TaxID=2675878 RepID=UPI0020B73ED7|nr:hypothetical protein [Hymenobacter sp. BRD128]